VCTAGWIPFEEALCYSSERALQVLVEEHKRVLSSRMKDRLLQLKEVFCDMPDCAFQVCNAVPACRKVYKDVSQMWLTSIGASSATLRKVRADDAPCRRNHITILDAMLQVSWDLSSPYLNAIFGKHMPKDTYTVYKCGSCLRIDGHMKGMNEDAKTLLPLWKYGHWSIHIDCDAPGGPSAPVYVSHDKMRYTRLEVRCCSRKCWCTQYLRHSAQWWRSMFVHQVTQGRGHTGLTWRLSLLPVLQTLDGEQDDPGSSATTSMMMQDSDVKRSRLKFSNFHLGPVKGWLSSSVQEKVNGMPTVVRLLHGSGVVVGMSSLERLQPDIRLCCKCAANVCKVQAVHFNADSTILPRADVRGERRAGSGHNHEGTIGIAGACHIRGLPCTASCPQHRGHSTDQLHLWLQRQRG
jgi:hypothetical protein